MSQQVSRIINTMVIIKESYAAYQNKVEAPQHNAIGGHLHKMEE
jgi:hypothetical protein